MVRFHVLPLGTTCCLLFSTAHRRLLEGSHAYVRRVFRLMSTAMVNRKVG